MQMTTIHLSIPYRDVLKPFPHCCSLLVAVSLSRVDLRELPFRMQGHRPLRTPGRYGSNHTTSILL